MNPRAIKVIWLRELRVHFRDKPRLLSSLARSILWMVIFGGGFGAARFPGLSVDYQGFLFPGVIAMSVLFTSMHSGVSVIWDREFGFMKEILVSPASRFSILAGKLFGGSSIAVMEGGLIMLLGPLMGVHMTPGKALAALFIMLLTSMSLVGIGLIIASMMKSLEGFQIIMSFFVMPMFFLSGAIFPLDKIPAWMTPLTMINPLTYGVDALRAVLMDMGHYPVVVDLAILVLAATLTSLAGTRAFQNSGG